MMNILLFPGLGYIFWIEFFFLYTEHLKFLLMINMDYLVWYRI